MLDHVRKWADFYVSAAVGIAAGIGWWAVVLTPIGAGSGFVGLASSAGMAAVVWAVALWAPCETLRRWRADAAAWKHAREVVAELDRGVAEPGDGAPMDHHAHLLYEDEVLLGYWTRLRGRAEITKRIREIATDRARREVRAERVARRIAAGA